MHPSIQHYQLCQALLAGTHLFWYWMDKLLVYSAMHRAHHLKVVPLTESND